MDRLLGMYIHTHWSYNQPYAARTWSLDKWRGYLTGLTGLGYNLVQIWPMLDTMPVPPTPSDAEHLEKLGQVIRFAHEELHMTVYVGICANASANNKASSFTFQNRNYFEAQELINPGDKAAMDREMERRRVLLEPLAEADGLWILDCDPGGYLGSPVSEFVEIFARHRELLDRIGSSIRLVYWMWAGWMDKHRFDPEWTGSVQDCWVEALEGLKRVNPEPWALHACWPGHFKTVDKLGLSDRAHFYPYNLVEYEPSYPFTNWEPERIARTFERFSIYAYPLGALGNSQTHCIQIPHAYLFSHFAQGGTLRDMDPAGFGERLIPGCREELAQAWQAMSIETSNSRIPRKAAEPLKSLLEQGKIETGELGGLFFGDVQRYLNDLILQLELWANILDLKPVEKEAEQVRPLLKRTVQSLHAWNDRHGFRDRYHDVYYYSHVHPIFKEAFAVLGTPEAEEAVACLDMLTGPQHGRTLMLLNAMDQALAPAPGC